jgi:hypothetical protein
MGCIHKKIRIYCIDCMGSAICVHKINKYFCKVCDGRYLCKQCELSIVKKTGNKCKTCDPAVNSKSRCREKQMAAQLESWADQELLPIYDDWNKQNPLADPSQCGKYRPDFVYEWDEGVLILEYDEFQHKDLIKRCELVRQAEVSMGFGGKPIMWFRFNPDAFKVEGTTMRTSKETREALLLDILRKHMGNENYDFLIQIVYICYDKQEREGDSDLVKTFQFATIENYEEWVDREAPPSL